MDTLDKIVRETVEHHCQKAGFGEGETVQSGEQIFSVNEIKEAMYRELRDKIISEVYEEKKKELFKEMKQKADEQRKQDSYIALKQIMWDAFVLAIFVGLLVNEITTLIEFFKTFAGSELHTVITVILIIVFSIIVLSLYIIKFTADIVKKFVPSRR